MRREQRAANIQKMKHKPSNVEVQIDELILHGFSAADRYAIGDALSGELSQLVTHSASNPFNQEINLSTYRAGEISILPDAQPTQIGAKVAQAVHAGLHTINKEGRS